MTLKPQVQNRCGLPSSILVIDIVALALSNVTKSKVESRLFGESDDFRVDSTESAEIICLKPMC
jgi:hypothetical protein